MVYINFPLLSFSLLLIFSLTPLKTNDEDLNNQTFSMFDKDHEYLKLGLLPSISQSKDVIDLYGMRGMMQEFMFNLLPRTFQCFHQVVEKSDNIYIHFQVMRGADKNIDFEILSPEGVSLKSFQWVEEGDLDTIAPANGIYTVCMDNRLSKYGAKVVNLYFLCYKAAEWEVISSDIENYVTSIKNFSTSFTQLEENVKKMISHKGRDAKRVLSDWHLLINNNSYVQFLSIFLIFLILLTSSLQVFFVRKLFDVPKVGGAKGT